MSQLVWPCVGLAGLPIEPSAQTEVWDWQMRGCVDLCLAHMHSMLRKNGE